MTKYTDLRGRGLLFLLCLWFVWFINFGVRTIFSPILPLIEDEFVVSHAQASSIFLFLSAGMGVAVIVAGLFSGIFGYKKSMIVSLALLGFTSLSIAFVHTFWLLFVVLFILGFAGGLYLPVVIPLITEYYSEQNWGKVIAIQDTGATVAVSAAPFIALFLLQFFPWRGIFLVFGFTFLIYAIIFSFASSEVKIVHRPKTAFRDLVTTRSLWILIALWIFGGGAYLGIYSIIPLYLTKELGVSIGYANTMLGISRLGAIVVAVSCGFLIDKFNLRKIMFLVLLTTGGLTILIGITSVSFMGIILFLQASFVVAFFPAGLVAISKIFSREMRSLATGLIIFLGGIPGLGLMPYLLGVSGDLYSFRLGITILGLCVTLSSWLVFCMKELE